MPLKTALLAIVCAYAISSSESDLPQNWLEIALTRHLSEFAASAVNAADHKQIIRQLVNGKSISPAILSVDDKDLAASILH